MKLTIMGHKWKVEYRESADDPILGNNLAYCDYSDRVIVMVKTTKVSVNNVKATKKEVLRHEIVHAFLEECGLSDESLATSCWAQNEEMIDWFAKKGPEIYAVWKAADCLPEEN